MVKLHKHIQIRDLKSKINDVYTQHGDADEAIKALTDRLEKIEEPRPVDLSDDRAFEGLNVSY